MIIPNLQMQLWMLTKSLRQRYNCSMINECKTEEKECFAFRIWVNNGGELNEKKSMVNGQLNKIFEDIK